MGSGFIFLRDYDLSFQICGLSERCTHKLRTKQIYFNNIRFDPYDFISHTIFQLVVTYNLYFIRFSYSHSTSYILLPKKRDEPLTTRRVYCVLIYFHTKRCFNPVREHARFHMENSVSFCISIKVYDPVVNRGF